ncbi:MAG: low molecular weight protein arginine phosphatase [Candidatus Omnitrophica bacterium]|nr:low molecular weight protein arginine phosphatase [Candidatus Omnitrophota bacterium]
MKYRKILFVCTGNSCRSPMAEGLLKQMIGESREDEFNIISAGIAAAAGIKATPKAIEVMKNHNIDISGHRTRKLTNKEIEKADLILVMERSHKDALIRLAPESASKTFLLGGFGLEAIEPDKNIDIPDPIGMPVEQYEYCFGLIQTSLNEVIKQL